MSSARSFKVVESFEEAVAEFAGSRFGVAVNTGTSAIFLSLEWMKREHGHKHVIIPSKTFISVPMCAMQAGYSIEFEDYEWRGVYQLKPMPVFDSALRFRKGMYLGGLQCLSFQARKLLNIGEGGMILTDDKDAVEWLKKARYWGRGGSFRVEDIEMMGWQMYMTPEKAGRGLHLLEYIKPDLADQHNEYPDLRQCPVFR